MHLKILIHPIYWCLPFFKQKLTSIYKYRRGLKYKCNENYFEFTLRLKDSSFRSFLISRIAICFIASKGERGATQVRHQDNRYQLRLCWAKRNKSSPLGRDHQRDVIKAGRKGVWRGKHGNNLILQTVASGQQWNQGGVPRDGGGWFNSAHFEAHLCAMSSWVSEMQRDGQGTDDLDLLLVTRMVKHPQSLTFRPCPYEIRWIAVYNKLWATRGWSLSLWADPLLGMEAENRKNMRASSPEERQDTGSRRGGEEFCRQHSPISQFCLKWEIHGRKSRAEIRGWEGWWRINEQCKEQVR